MTRRYPADRASGVCSKEWIAQNIYKAIHALCVSLGPALHHALALVALGRDASDGFGILALFQDHRLVNCDL